MYFLILHVSIFCAILWKDTRFTEDQGAKEQPLFTLKYLHAANRRMILNNDVFLATPYLCPKCPNEVLTRNVHDFTALTSAANDKIAHYIYGDHSKWMTFLKKIVNCLPKERSYPFHCRFRCTPTRQKEIKFRTTTFSRTLRPRYSLSLWSIRIPGSYKYEKYRTIAVKYTHGSKPKGQSLLPHI